MINIDELYLQNAKEIITEGRYQFNKRTSQGTFSRFGIQYRADLTNENFPLLTTKKLHTRSITHELLWFLKGDTNIKYLNDNGVKIWDEWADENGDLGRVYAAQWRDWRSPSQVPYETIESLVRENNVDAIYRLMQGESVDQIEKLIKGMRENPSDRGHIVSAWNPGELEKMALRPCHCLFQFDVADGEVSCQLYQRSADWLQGVPFNIASYSIFDRLVANTLNLEAGEFIHTFGNAHIYLAEGERGEFYNKHKNKFVEMVKQATDPEDFRSIREWIMEEAPLDPDLPRDAKKRIILDDHMPFLLTQMSRKPRKSPKLKIRDKKGVFDVKYEDLEIKDYDPHPTVNFVHNNQEFKPGIAV